MRRLVEQFKIIAPFSVIWGREIAENRATIIACWILESRREWCWEIMRWAEHVCAVVAPAVDLSWPSGVDIHHGDSIALILAASPGTLPWRPA